MSRQRIGFIGLGAMGLSHARSIQRLCSDTAEVAGLCGSREAGLKEILPEFPGAKPFKTLAEMLQADIEAVFVSTPNNTHARMAEEVITAGKHLFLEKPCGITNAECQRLVELSESTRKVVMIGHELRYSPYFQRIKELVDDGAIGKPHLVWTREFRGPFQKKSGDWIQDERRSGGCLVDKNCHHFDLMNWWVGSTPRRVAAFGGCAVNRVIPGPHQVNDHAVVSFEYANEARGALQLCMFALDFPHEDLEMGIVGDAGMLVTRISQIEILQWKHGAGQKAPLVHKVNARPGEGWGSHLGFDEIHTEFLACIREGRPPLTTPRNCGQGTLVAIAAEEAIKSQAIVQMS